VDDTDHAARLLDGVVGKRLTIKRLLQGEEPIRIWRPSRYQAAPRRWRWVRVPIPTIEDRRPKRMTQNEQSERFTEAARAPSVDESGEEFKRA
jgi:hypothetical protein